jgi:ATP-dependent DNA helicase RecG
VTAGLEPAELALIPLGDLKGVGPRVGERLGRLGLSTVQDLLLHLPLRYQDRTRVVPVAALRAGDEAAVEAEVLGSEVSGSRQRMLVGKVADGSGVLSVRFFNFNPGISSAFRKGRRLRLFGEVREGYAGLEMIHPEFQDAGKEGDPAANECLTPVYPSTEGLHQLTLRALTDQALARMEVVCERADFDLLPEPLRQRYGLPALAEALRVLHRPPAPMAPDRLLENTCPARRRLIFEELLAHNLSLRELRALVQQHPAHVLVAQRDLPGRFVSSLPFRLTSAQRRVIGEIASDLALDRPMMRLLQGDVGSGKTVVAAAAALQAVAAGFQVALMAPTELLVEQHYLNFSNWLKPLQVPVAWLAGGMKVRRRRQVLEQMANGEVAIALGTHALFQDDVEFRDLALVVIDEQHRFGVHQRYALREKGKHQGRLAHQLIMTATPIPRTLAMTAYADLDHSVLDELPPGRTPVTTVVLPDRRRREVVERVDRACRNERQAYWVCTLIEESEALQCQTAEATARDLTAALPELTVGLVHGRMSAADKETAMRAFKAGDTDLLVATTVVEVGMDVANASLMIIENAERLGLAQLHQLRGRVGRGRIGSYCVLMYKDPLTENARARLEVLREHTDGFEIARRDLEIRGPGEVLGTRQTGLLNLRVADLVRDRALLEDVHSAGTWLLSESPQRAATLAERWIGAQRGYGGV